MQRGEVARIYGTDDVERPGDNGGAARDGIETYYFGSGVHDSEINNWPATRATCSLVTRVMQR